MSLSQNLYNALLQELVNTNNPDYILDYISDAAVKKDGKTTGDSFQVSLIRNYSSFRQLYEITASEKFKSLECHLIKMKDKDEFRIKVNKQKEYVYISLYYGKWEIDKYGNVFLSEQKKWKNKNIMIIDDGRFLKKYKERYIPASLECIASLPETIAWVICKEYFPTLFWKDVAADKFLSSDKLQDVRNYHSKQDYLEHIFRVSLPKGINRLNLNQGYMACCAIDFVCDEQKNLLFDKSMWKDIQTILEYSENSQIRYMKREKKEYAAIYISALLCARTHITKLESDIFYVVWDYVKIALTNKEPVNLLMGKKQIQRLHDKYVDEIMRAEIKDKEIIIPDTPLKYLRLPDEFVMITTALDLYMEGKRNNNCVFTYCENINKGKCVIYAADIDDEHLTIEICRRGQKIYVNQCLTKYNQSCKEKTLGFVNETVDSASKDAVKEYKKAKKTTARKNSCLISAEK